MSETFRDGVRAERCVTCGSMLRDAGGAPMVSIQFADAKALLLIFGPVVPIPGLQKRLEQAVGQTAANLSKGQS